MYATSTNGINWVKPVLAELRYANCPIGTVVVPGSEVGDPWVEHVRKCSREQPEDGCSCDGDGVLPHRDSRRH